MLVGLACADRRSPDGNFCQRAEAKSDGYDICALPRGRLSTADFTGGDRLRDVRCHGGCGVRRLTGPCPGFAMEFAGSRLSPPAEIATRHDRLQLHLSP